MNHDTQAELDPPDMSASPASGWVVFAGVALALAASSNLVYGITMLVNSDWIVITPEALVRFDLTTVGVTYLIFAAVKFFVALGVFAGELWARAVGITIAALNMLTQFAFMSLYPAWSWFVIIVDAVIIYGLAVHGDEIGDL